MAYNYGSYPYYYNPYQAANTFTAPPYQYQGAQQPQVQPQMQQQPSYSGFQWVRGESAAKAFRAEPGQTVLLMDSDEPVLYVNSTDINGKPAPMITYDLIERAPSAANKVTEVQVQDLSEYAKKADVSSMLQNINLNDYIKRSEVDEYIKEVVGRAVNDKISNIRFAPQQQSTSGLVTVPI